MKTIKIFSLFAVLAMVLTGCQEDDFGKGAGSAMVGDEIVFGGTAGYNAKTRTVYGDKWPAEGSEKGYTEIKWYTGDKVRIYCEQALPVGSGDAAVQYCDYNVVDGLSTTADPTDESKEESHSSSLTAIGEAGLMWGDEEKHIFYGVYPAPGQLANESADALSQEAAGKLELNGNTLKGYLPNRQTPLSGINFVQTTADGNHIVHPAMRYAYMVARAEAATTASTVNLPFDPVVTAVEITLVNNSADKVDGVITNTNDVVNIQGFRVSSDEVICGDFSVDIDTKTNTVSSTDDTHKQVFIPAVIDELAFGKSVTFTAFMMLDNSVAGLDNLTVTVIMESGQKSARLNGKNNGLIVQAKMKNFLNGVNLNLGAVSTTLNASNWLSHIPNQINGQDVLVRCLSIPGAGGAASYTQYESNPEYAQQSLTISQQWNQGIRCFEFAVDLPATGKAFGEQEIVCNGRTTGVLLKNAVDAVVARLNGSPNEFAMIILTYENLGGWADAVDATRDPATFMSGLKTFWDGYSDVTALFNPATTTMASARGKLFCIARPTSAYYDDGPTINESKNLFGLVDNVSLSYNSKNLIITSNLHEDILIVNGWGSLKDKWEARGYTGNIYRRGTEIGFPSNLDSSLPGRPFDASTLTDSWTDNDIEQSNYTSQVTKCLANDANFFYPIQLGNSTTATSKGAWVQEWARVSPEDASIVEIVETNATKKVYWAPTIAEKEQRIKETLDYAMGKTQGDILYINSLCGFFVDGTIVESYRPHAHTDRSLSYDLFDGGYKDRGFTESSEFSGMEGNIDAYAEYINNYFYKLLTDMQAANELNDGMGIILMDRVSNSAETDPAGYYIPQIIWTNNTYDVEE